jgi:flavorubredoxin
MINTKRGRPISERNKEFLDAWKKWNETKEKQYWDIMFTRAYDACLQAVKSCLRGCFSMDDDDIIDKATDAACRFMEKIKNNSITFEGVASSSLSAFVHFPVVEAVYGPAVRRADNETCTDDTTLIDYKGSFTLNEEWLIDDIENNEYNAEKTYLTSD